MRSSATCARWPPGQSRSRLCGDWKRSARIKGRVQNDGGARRMLIAILPLLLALQQPPAESSTLGAAELLLRQNRYEDAIRELRSALEREPQSGEAVRSEEHT